MFPSDKNLNAEDICKKLQSFISDINLEEIKELNIACKSVLKQFVENPTRFNNITVIKIQAILDYTYEKINIGNWKDVNPYLRKTMTIASYFKLLMYLRLNEQSSQKEVLLKEAFKIIDYGLLFGCPLNTEPQLLQKCATLLNEIYHKDCIIDCHIKSNTDIDISISNKYIGLEIETVNCPSMETFYSNYILKEKPVVLNNCINHWPALTKWQDQDYLLKLAGLRIVPIEIGIKYTDSEWTQKLMTLQQFIEEHIYKTNNTTGYLAQYQLFEQIPELSNDISQPEYCCFSDSDETVDVNAWYGPKGTVSPLHHDPKKNLLAQVVGQKIIYLFSPLDSEYLYPHQEELLNNTAKVDPRKPDLDVYPKYSKATPMFCVLKPGQLLYIPPKWWHFVESLSVSFSVSFWWN